MIDKLPNIYFVGNQDHFEATLINDGKTRLISVPSFNSTKSVVILDPTTFEVFEYKFNFYNK